MKEPKIALVLSGGAALGYAHLGVLEELIKEGIKPDIIVGTSMGAVIGGAYACGLSVEAMLGYIDKMSMFKFVDINFKPTGAFKGTRITDLLSKAYKDMKVSECICKFATIAVDIVDGEQHVLDSGKVLDVVRASMNIPGLLVPYEIDGTRYVDGGIINNYPDDVAKSLGADIIIGVDVLRNSLPLTMPKNFVMTLFKSLQVLQNKLYEYKKSYTDVLMAPFLNNLGMADFNKETANKAIEIGRQECISHMKEIKKVINNWKKKNN